MIAIRQPSLEAFWRAAGDLLLADEAANGLPLGIVLYARRYPARTRDIHLWTVSDATGALRLCAVNTPPRDLTLVGAPGDWVAAVAALIALLRAEGQPLPGVSAAPALAAAFAAQWQVASGDVAQLAMAQRIYALARVESRPAVAGQLRRATAGDLALLADWFDAFDREAIGGTPGLPPATDFVSAAIERGEFFVWDVAGVPVTMVKTARPLLHGITLSAVYTPPPQRGAGYASACVAALSQQLLDAGWQFCTLFTDLANPTSNKIYQRIGYRPVADWDRYTFAPPAAQTPKMNDASR